MSPSPNGNDSGADHPDAAEMLSRLFPGSADDGAGREFLALPSVDRARMFLPLDPALAARSLRRARRPVGMRDRVRTRVGAGLLRAGLGRVLQSRVTAYASAGEGSIERELSGLLGRPVTVAVFLGPPRANRKPVLQVLDAQGELLGVAKVGVNDLTSRLARAEASALSTLSRRALGSVVVPRLLCQGTWRGHNLLVQSALPVWEHPAFGSEARSLTDAALAEIALSGTTHRQPAGSSPYVARLLTRVEALVDPGIRAAALTLVERAQQGHDAEVLFGSWHGDLTAWNMAPAGDHVLVWDWERFSPDVPVGFDALHHVFLPSLKATATERREAARALLRRAPEVLAAMPIDPCTAETVARLYLAEIGCRFSTDAQADTGVAGGDVAEWLLPAATDLTSLTKG